MSWSSYLHAGSLPAGPAPGGLLIALLGLPLGAALVPPWLGERGGRRAAAALLLGTAALAAYLAIVLAVSGHGAAELTRPLWPVLTVNRLKLTVGLGLDAPAAALLSGAALLGGAALRTAPRPPPAWVGAACFAAALGLLADSLVLRLAGWELLLATGHVLGRRRLAAALWLGRAGDAALLLGTVLLFWALGGSWSSSRLDSHYQLDASPPQSAQGPDSGPEPARELADPSPLAPSPRAEPGPARVAPSPGAALGPSLELGPLRAQLHADASYGADRSGRAAVPAARAALANKLWPGGRLLGWLLGLFAAAAALKASSGLLQLATERRAAWALRGFLGAAPAALAAHLLWRLW